MADERPFCESLFTENDWQHFEKTQLAYKRLKHFRLKSSINLKGVMTWAKVTSLVSRF